MAESLDMPPVVGWSWPMKKVARTANTLVRFWVGRFPLEPTPAGVRCELRLNLQRWNAEAKDPFSWCISLMKYGTDEAGKSTGPFQPYQHIQVSEKDWQAFFGAWGETGSQILRRLELMQRSAPAIQIELTPEKEVG